MAQAIADPNTTEIHVADGIYHEHDLPLRNLTIRGGYGGTTTLDGDNEGRMFVANVPAVVRLENLAITRTTDWAIRFFSPGSLELYGCRFYDITNYGGIHATGVPVTALGCTFENLVSFPEGGAIRHIGGALTLTDCRFINCRTNFGAGVMKSGGSMGVFDCTFSGCGAEGGAGIGAYNARCAIHNCKFIGNRSWFISGGAGLCVYGNSAARISGCAFIDNEATWEFPYRPGSAIHAMDTSRVTAIDCLFLGNTAPAVMAIEQAIIQIAP
jgi:hypothetical protein